MKSKQKRKEKLKAGSVRFSKFTLVGGLNAAVDIGVLNALIWLEPTRDPSVLALYNVVALVLANLNSYVFNSLWTFRGRSTPGLYQTITFAGQALVNIGVSSLLFYLLVRPIVVYTEMPAYLATNASKVISIAVASTLSYFLMRYLVFSTKQPLKKPVRRLRKSRRLRRYRRRKTSVEDVLEDA
ncbi:GtrA family protein [Rubrobacter radiotolerans]|uniref:GtrA family protein n=1 Tax=Rubrobacter radiotolerans TaxID=42256 RepID=A0AB35T2N7_RUBRA|nr:GtrA family protein [Rubrobacter radiotolerans]MDX5893965.1 GtrA family protein [Rubrobacter radiotolerans]